MEVEKNFSNTIEACRYCPMCKHVCSSEFISFRESDTPRGRAILLYEIYKGKSDYEKSVVDSIYNCFLCGCCWSWCVGRDEGGYDIPGLIQNARIDIVKKGLAPEVAVKIKESVVKNGNHYEIALEDSFSYKMKEKKSDILYYMGPEINFKNKEIAEAMIKIFKKLGIDFTILKNELSGGKILEILGFREEAIDRAKELYQKIKDTRCKLVIISDPLSYDFIKNDFPNFGLKLKPSVKVMHVSEYLNSKIKNGSLVLKKIKDIVTIADSEYLGRFNGIFEDPRNIIKSASNSNIVEMEWSRDKMLSSGEAAYIFQSKKFADGSKLGEKIFKMAKDKSVNEIVTLSPTAKNNIENAAGKEMKVLDIAEFVAELI